MYPNEKNQKGYSPCSTVSKCISNRILILLYLFWFGMYVELTNGIFEKNKLLFYMIIGTQYFFLEVDRPVSKQACLSKFYILSFLRFFSSYVLFALLRDPIKALPDLRCEKTLFYKFIYQNHQGNCFYFIKIL